MILPLLDDVRHRVLQADAVGKQQERLTLDVLNGDVVSVATDETSARSLRVQVDGRLGLAGSTAGDAPLADAAIAAARLGPEVALLLPVMAPLPAVLTHTARAAAASVAELTRLARRINERLRRDGRDVSIRARRSTGAVHVANTRDVEAAYQTSLVSLAVSVRTRGADDAAAGWGARHAAVDVPDDSVIDWLVAEIERPIRWAARVSEPPGPGRPVMLLPRAFRALLEPVLAAFTGGAAPAAPDTEGPTDRAFSECLTITDDPLVPGRPGSRPIDDEGVQPWAAALIETGVARRPFHTLESGARSGMPASGRAHWGTFARPHASPSNVIVAPGTATLADLFQVMGDGLVVNAVSGGSVARNGSFVEPVLSGFRVAGGEVSGRVQGAVIAGNIFRSLNAVMAVGAEAGWYGSSRLPSVVIEGVSVGAR